MLESQKKAFIFRYLLDVILDGVVDGLGCLLADKSVSGKGLVKVRFRTSMMNSAYTTSIFCCVVEILPLSYSWET